MYTIVCKLEFGGWEELEKILLHLYRVNVTVLHCNVSKQINNLFGHINAAETNYSDILKVNNFILSLFELNLHLEHV